MLGLWSATSESYGLKRRVYRREGKESFKELAFEVGLDPEEIHAWGRFVNGPKGDEKVRAPYDAGCYVSVPNIWVTADLLRGGGVVSRIISFGGTIGVFIGTDLTRFGYEILKPETFEDLVSQLDNYRGDIIGLTLYSHGNDDGVVSPHLGAYEYDSIEYWKHNQQYIIEELRKGGYKVRKVNAMQCESFAHGSFRRIKLDERGTQILSEREKVEWEKRWKSVSNLPPSGYKGDNILGLDL